VKTVNTINSTILPFVHAEGDNLHASFDQIEREIDLAFELKRERAEHEKTRAALAEQTTASQRIANEREIERSLRAHPNLNPKAAANVTKLILQGDAGELEQDKHGKLREKFGARNLDEVAADYLRLNPHFLGSGNADSAQGASQLDKRTMTAKQIADYVEAHGQDAFHALPRSKDPRTK
jgi:Tfp pilus assembly PilM family ATPase